MVSVLDLRYGNKVFVVKKAPKKIYAKGMWSIVKVLIRHNLVQAINDKKEIIVIDPIYLRRAYPRELI